MIFSDKHIHELEEDCGRKGRRNKSQKNDSKLAYNIGIRFLLICPRWLIPFTIKRAVKFPEDKASLKLAMQ